MRLILSVLLILLVAWGVHALLETRAPAPRLPKVDPLPEVADGDDPGRPVARHATLIVHVLAPDGKPVEDGEIGTEVGGAVRWYPAGLDGIRSFFDLEPGPVRVRARAPGRKSAEQRRHLAAGVRADMRFVLRPKK